MNLLKLLPYVLIGLMACQHKTDTERIDPVEPTGTSTPTAIGQPIGAPITKTIGPAGGTLFTPDGKFSLTFPAGAVSKETAITVQPVENNAPNGVGMGYHVSPDNLTFEQPVTYDYIYKDAEVTGSAVDAMGLAVQASDKTWKFSQPVTVNKSQKKVTAKVEKANWWALVTEYRLVPDKDTVFLGESKEIKLMHLKVGHWPDWTKKPVAKAGPDPEIDIPPLIDPEEVRNGDIEGLTLNGVNWASTPPQDKTWGTVGWSQTDTRITYIAPGTKPATGNPVTISVEIMNPMSAKMIVSGQLYIKGDNAIVADGRNFNRQFTVSASYAMGILSIDAHGVDSTGKDALMSVMIKGPKVASYTFDDIGDKCLVSLMNMAAKEDEYDGISIYKKCHDMKASNGSVAITQFTQAKGYMKLTCRISGDLVTVHEEDDKCGVKKHMTTKVFCEFTTLVKQ